MKKLIIPLIAVAWVVIIGSFMVPIHAFALQHFFNCITEQSNKDGGDHNLTEQQVINCFEKEFPNNPGVSGHHSSQILSGFNH